MIAHHLPILQIIIPLMSAPICLVLRRARIAWVLSLAVSWICLVISVALLVKVLDGGAISYEL